jgi:hypothetical protein
MSAAAPIIDKKELELLVHLLHKNNLKKHTSLFHGNVWIFASRQHALFLMLTIFLFVKRCMLLVGKVCCIQLTADFPSLSDYYVTVLR